MRIYFPIETKKRELIARIYFALKCALRGASVVIGTKNALLRRMNLMKKGIIFFKSIQPNQHQYIKKFRNNSFKIASLDEEGLMSFTDENYLRRFKEENFQLIDIYFSWGEKEKKALLSKFKNYEKFIKVVGNSRMDILKRPISKIFSDEAEILRERFGDFILLTTKFCRHNPIRRGWSTYYMGQLKAGYIKSQHHKQLAILSEYHEKKNLKEFIDFIKIFSNKFPEKKLVVRIHPSEDRSIWIKNTSKLKNVYVSYDDISTNSYILASKFVIQSNCTTSLESFLLDKLSVNYLPYNNDKVEYPIPKLVSKNIFNQHELIEFIKNSRDHKKKQLSITENNNLKDFACNIFTDNCIDLMYEELKKIFQDKKDKDKFSNIFTFPFFKLENILKNFYFSLTQRSDFDKGLRKLQKQKIPSLTLKEITFLKNEICKQIEINPKKIKVIEKYPAFYEFSSSN